MEANDSAECRNCHAYEAMAFEHQSSNASAQMRQAFADGETCIACHKGVAHELPDMARSHEELFAELKAMARDLDRDAAQVHTIRTQNVFASAEDATGGGRPAGRLLPGTELTVLGRDGDAMQVRLEGWRQDGVDRAIYALMGKRILSVALSPAAIDMVARHETRRDDDTELTWHRVSADLGIAPGGVVADEERIWAYGAALNTAACSSCHALAQPGHHLANQWIGILKSMERFSTLDDEQTRMLQKYLQLHAGDVAGHGGEREARLAPARARDDG